MAELLSLEQKSCAEEMPAIIVFSPMGKDPQKTQGYRRTEAEKIITQLRTLLP